MEDETIPQVDETQLTTDGGEVQKIQLKAQVVGVTVKLERQQGDYLKDLIQEKYVYTFPRYCQMVGISPPNFYNTLNGERPCTLEFLNKLLSGIEFEAVLTNPEVVIQELEIGQVVVDVDSILQEKESSCNEGEEPDTTD